LRWPPGDRLTAVSISQGLQDIGGGLYQRTAPDGGVECWFASLLAAERVQMLLHEVDHWPADGGGDPATVTATVGSDPALGISVVRVHGGAADTGRLLASAYRLLSAVLVAELVEATGDDHPPDGAPSRPRST
jgi:hypothetical protein